MGGAGTKSFYQPQLDGLRAIVIVGVLLHHYGLHIPDFLEYGPLSVRIFFALTGYFITIWLWKAEDTAHASDISVWRELPVFHGRRLLRLVPPLYLSLLIAVIFSLEVSYKELPWHLLFASNFYITTIGYWPPTISHLWSLSVQEQFYLFWPIIILFIPRRFFLWVLGAAVVVAFGFRVACVLWDINPIIRWTMLPGSLDSFAIGGFVAWLAQGKIGAPIMNTRQRWGYGLIAVICLLIGHTLRSKPQGSLWIPTIELWEGAFIGWIIAATAQGWGGLLGRILSFPPLVYIGKISLGIYLFHVLVHIFFGPWIDAAGITNDVHNLLRVFILVALAIGAAALSWHFLERPLSRFKPQLAKTKTKA